MVGASIWRPGPTVSRVFSATQPHKGNLIIQTYGPSDWNSTHVRMLGNLRREPPTQVSNTAVREARPKRKQGSNPWMSRVSQESEPF
jgi:hypothetical protein